MWNWLNGKKVIIGSVFLVAAAFGQEVLLNIWQLWPVILPKVIETCNWIGMALGGVGLIHKAVKRANAQ
jgi:hypothetical protein